MVLLEALNLKMDVVVGGQAGFAGHLKIGKGAKIAGQAGITKDVAPGAFLKGNSCIAFSFSLREFLFYKKDYPSCSIDLKQLSVKTNFHLCKAGKQLKIFTGNSNKPLAR